MTTTTDAAAHPKRPRRSKKPGGYRDRLQPDDRSAYTAASSDLDLQQEIKLLRTTLASLADGLPGTAHTIKEVSSVLTRMIYVQARTLGLGGSLEQELMDAADLALDRLALEDLDGFA